MASRCSTHHILIEKEFGSCTQEDVSYLLKRNYNNIFRGKGMNDIKFIPIEDVRKKELLCKFSPVYLLAKELNLKLLMRYKNKFFFGPPYDLAEILDLLTTNFRVKNILDLFSGSGALAKVALINGVKKTTCVDTTTKAIKVNLEEFKNRIDVIKTDILKMEFNDFYDLVVLDPPEELLVNVCKNVFPKLSDKTNLIIMWYSDRKNKQRDKKVEELSKKLFNQRLIIEIYGLKTIFCSNTKRGTKYLKFLERKFKTNIKNI